MVALVLIPALLLITVQAAELPEKTNEFFIADYAGVISEENKKLILNHSAALDKATTAQIAVVTVDSTGGKAGYEYASDLGNEWGVGDEEKDNGVIILLNMGKDTGEKEIFVAPGEGIRGTLTASLCGRIIDDYGMEHLKKGDYSTGVYQIFLAVLAKVYEHYNLEVPDEVEDAMQSTKAGIWDILIPFALILVLVILLSLKRKGNNGDDDNNHHGGFGGGFPIGPIILGRGFYGGPRSGGGFGGGGFGGGGGSFGGGGAGRKF